MGLTICFPSIAVQVDWRKPVEFLDKTCVTDRGTCGYSYCCRLGGRTHPPK